MSITASLLQNDSLAALSRQAGPKVTLAVQQAAQTTGVDFAYLLQQAKAESSFDTDAQAKTSSARGLYQFIESTWLGMVDRYGSKHGIDINQPRSDLLALRDDPELASKMAAEFAYENQDYLERHWAKGEKTIGSTELYMAHFMGAGGAASFLRSLDENPLQPAAELFPKAATANEAVFYDRQTKQARSLSEVYAFFDRKFEDTPIQQSSQNTASEPPEPSILPLTSFHLQNGPRHSPTAPQKDFFHFFENMSPLSQRWLGLSTMDFISLLHLR